MNIQEVALMTGMTKATIRYYEQVGLIKPERTEGNYRKFSTEDVKRLKLIVVLQYIDFDLNSIKTIINSLDLPPSEECNRRINHLFTAKYTQLQKKIADYQTVLKVFDEITLPVNHQDYAANQASYYQQTMDLMDSVFEQLR